ncbi:class I SAM-dependent methyltransferase [Lacipirellula parvula]|uniref:Methyltransferase domain-containing protein n=1 Tax=Lacipirellula parvula TaxID=2650471 RepID=A0A5K7XCL1_9BACT|nr:class I SAM-dependent methyltransferase [Lacipirellula parvula]BBO34198.1 hypothetical protein PLANPX_3810 [Lacipirellula parvula]
MPPELQKPSAAFSDPEAVARYAEGPPRLVPGFADMHRMAALLLAERVPEKGSVLIVGAGGGLELKTFAQASPSWVIDGIDPSMEMLDLAKKYLESCPSRVQLHHGFINVAPEGPYDAATCLLTMHFASIEERREMAAEVFRRLKPGAPFVVVHFSIPEGATQRSIWASRFAAFAMSSGLSVADAQRARTALELYLTVLSPEQDEAILRDTGFTNVSLFYAGFAFRGWVAYAPNAPMEST